MDFPSFNPEPTAMVEPASTVAVGSGLNDSIAWRSKHADFGSLSLICAHSQHLLDTCPLVGLSSEAVIFVRKKVSVNQWMVRLIVLKKNAPPGGKIANRWSLSPSDYCGGSGTPAGRAADTDGGPWNCDCDWVCVCTWVCTWTCTGGATAIGAGARQLTG